MSGRASRNDSWVGAALADPGLQKGGGALLARRGQDLKPLKTRCFQNVQRNF